VVIPAPTWIVGPRQVRDPKISFISGFLSLILCAFRRFIALKE